MNDLRVVSARVMLPIQGVAPTYELPVPAVLVRGERFDQLSELFYNGVKVLEMVVLSPSRMLARIPNSEVGRPLRDIVAYASTSLARMSASVVLSIPGPLQTVSGIDRLVQVWLMIFMTSPGSDVFEPSSGGGGLAIIGRPTDRAGNSLSADLALAVERTSEELLRKQAGTSVPLDERLLSGSLASLSFDDTTATLMASVVLTNMAGERAQVAVG